LSIMFLLGEIVGYFIGPREGDDGDDGDVPRGCGAPHTHAHATCRFFIAHLPPYPFDCTIRIAIIASP
jgi:hypothetical protein